MIFVLAAEFPAVKTENISSRQTLNMTGSRAAPFLIILLFITHTHTHARTHTQLFPLNLVLCSFTTLTNELAFRRPMGQLI